MYDIAALDKLAAENPWLTIIPAVSADPSLAGEKGTLPNVVMRRRTWTSHDAYIAGPTEMVHETAARLADAGTPAEQIHVEDFGWSDR